MVQEIGSGLGKVFDQIGGETIGSWCPYFADAPGRVPVLDFFVIFLAFPLGVPILGQRFEKLAMATVDIRIGHGFFLMIC